MYTLWSHGRLLGTSTLDFVRVLPRHRTGFLIPTPLGDELLPIASGVGPAFRAMAQRTQDAADAMRPDTHLLERLRGTTEYADLVAAQDRCAALALELRREDGTRIPTEWIDVRDGEHLLALAHEIEVAEELDDWSPDREARDAELDAAVARDLELLDAVDDAMLDDDGHWITLDPESPLPRWQLQVKLLRDRDVP